MNLQLEIMLISDFSNGDFSNVSLKVDFGSEFLSSSCEILELNLFYLYTI
jgi:hypothetical protein